MNRWKRVTISKTKERNNALFLVIDNGLPFC